MFFQMSLFKSSKVTFKRNVILFSLNVGGVCFLLTQLRKKQCLRNALEASSVSEFDTCDKKKKSHHSVSQSCKQQTGRQHSRKSGVGTSCGFVTSDTLIG